MLTTDHVFQGLNPFGVIVKARNGREAFASGPEEGFAATQVDLLKGLEAIK
jgi:16S rRNA U1498 N3-methylase RsmE